MFELAGIRYAAGVGVAVEALHNIHARLQETHKVAQLELIGPFRQFDASALALGADNETKLCQPVGNLDQMVV